jgi:hypothetical protein
VIPFGPYDDPVVLRAAYQRRDPVALAHYDKRIRELRARRDSASHLLVANEFYFAAHEPVDFSLRLYEPMLPLALSAALLAEQVLYGTIVIRSGAVRVQTPPNPVEDPLVLHVYQQLSQRQQVTSVQEWFELLNERSHAWVVERLTHQGLLVTTERRRRFRTLVMDVPTDPLGAGAGMSRVAGLLSRQESLEPEDAVLVALMDAADLRKYVLAATVPDKRGADHQGVIRVRLDRLPTRELPPDFEELLFALRSAADSIRLSGLS